MLQNFFSFQPREQECQFVIEKKIPPHQTFNLSASIIVILIRSRPPYSLTLRNAKLSIECLLL